MKKLLLAGASTLAFLTATPALAQSNSSAVSQTGTGAVATVTQNGANDRSSVTQTGGGTVTVKQTGIKGSTSTVTTGADDRPPESTVKVTQSDTGGAAATGEANVSTVIQDNVNGFGATGTGSTVEVAQIHNAAGAGQNSSYVRQGTNAVSGQVTVSQAGGENISSYSSFTSFDNDADITQTGVGNSSTVTQNFQGRGALASVSQNNSNGGGVNSATIDQISSGYAANPAEFALGAEARIDQDGARNTSSISQSGYADLMTEGNLAENVQVGDDHDSSIAQSGIDNVARVTQTGVNNNSVVNQGGDMNSATVSQSTDNNVSSVNQSGNGNTATVTQGAL